MRTDAYREWLAAEGSRATIDALIARAVRIERHYGDLDEPWRRDRLAGLLEALNSTREAERRGAPDPARSGVGGDLWAGLSNARTAIVGYGLFKRSREGGPPGRASDALRKLFLARQPDFVAFDPAEGVYWAEARRDKDERLERAATLMRDAGGRDDEALGRGRLHLLRTPPANFVEGRAVWKMGAEGQGGVASAIGRLLRDPRPVPEAVEAAARAIPPCARSASSTA